MQYEYDVLFKLSQIEDTMEIASYFVWNDCLQYKYDAHNNPS
jgi:hypothetical protein